MAPGGYILFVILLAGWTVAERVIKVDGGDSRIKYTTANLTDTGYPTWLTVGPAPGNCDKTQHQTERLGDYATFIFNGTSLSVIGTIGVRKGVIKFTLDGSETTIDRTAASLKCDVVIFEKTGLFDQQHTFVAELIGKGMRTTGAVDGILSIQRIRYTVPGNPDINKGIIIAASVGSVVFIAICIAFFFLFRRRRRLHAAWLSQNQNIQEPDNNTGNMTVVPFEWNGPQTPDPPTLPQTNHTSIINDPKSATMSPTSDVKFSPTSSTFPKHHRRRSSNFARASTDGGRSPTDTDYHSRLSSSSSDAFSGREGDMADLIAQRALEIMQGRSAVLPPPEYQPRDQPMLPEVDDPNLSATQEAPHVLLPGAQEGAGSPSAMSLRSRRQLPLLPQSPPPNESMTQAPGSLGSPSPQNALPPEPQHQAAGRSP